MNSKQHNDKKIVQVLFHKYYNNKNKKKSFWSAIKNIVNKWIQ